MSPNIIPLSASRFRLILKSFFTSTRENSIALAIFVILWFGLSAFFDPYILPSPILVFLHARDYFTQEFFTALRVTLMRIAVGFSCSFLTGTILGIVSFVINAQEYINVFLIFCQVIPGIILGIILLMIFGVGHGVPVALIAFLTIPVMAINVANGLLKRNIQLEQLITSLGGGRYALIRDLYIPQLLPVLKSNMTVGFGIALKIVVLGEFLGSENGLGYLLNTAKIYFRMNEVFFYFFILLVVMGLFQIMINIIFTALFQKFLYSE